MPALKLKECSFKNSDEPIDEVHLEIVGDDGVMRKVPALDKYWISRSVFAQYTSLIKSDGRLKDGIELVEWQHEAECFQQDMQYLLQRPYNIFWSYMIYEKSAIRAIISFLQHAIPIYLDSDAFDLNQDPLKLYEKILCLVLRVICRLITNKESPNAWMRKEKLASIIYSNYLITVPMLFDLTVAIGTASHSNSSTLKRIFQTVLELEPKYKNDLLAALAFYRAAFRSIQTQADNEGFEGAGGGTLDDSIETPYDDVALYTLDCAYSLSVLMEICPTACTLSAEINLGKSIANFYDSTISNLYKNICQINEAAISLSWLNQARLRFLNAFRCIAYSYIETVLKKPEDSLSATENYLALMTDSLSEQLFVVDYERIYPIALDVDILRQTSPNLDEFKANFIVQGYQQEALQAAVHTYENIANLSQSLQAVLINEDNSNILPERNGDKEPNTQSPKKDCSSSERDIDLEVTSVLDILPDLDTGFIRRILSRYENSDQAVAAILEQNLPPDLVMADEKEPDIPLDPQDKLFLDTGIKHFNVYDGDAYDVMTQNKPDCVIKRGKGLPNAPKNASQMLDDKSFLSKVRHRYQVYSLVSDEDDVNALYDDEYDDSYEGLLESETRVVRSKDLRAVLANVQDVSEDEDDVESDSESNRVDNTKANQINRMAFCENPEDVRTRYEAKRQAKWSHRSGETNYSSKTNVVGAPRGQGQDKETLRNRQKKEANKSSRGNHNRKSGAAFKRSKGMIP